MVEEPELALAADDSRPRRASALLVLSLAWGLLSFPFTYFGVIAFIVELNVLPGAGSTSFLALPGLAACGWVAGSIGLMLRRAWGWWLVFWSSVICVLHEAKMAVSLLSRVRWEHPDANEVLVVVGLVDGVPILIALALLALAMAHRVRVHFGISSAPRPRRRRVVGQGSGSRGG